VKAAHDQTVKNDDDDDEAQIKFDDEDEENDPASVIDEEYEYANNRGNLHPPKAMVDREPEMEPEFEGIGKKKALIHASSVPVKSSA